MNVLNCCMETIKSGVLLVAEPFLKDPNFSRTVILLCDHQKEGSFGFVINRQIDHTLTELLPESTALNIPVGYGGPVQRDTLHFLHCRPDLIPGGMELTDNIFWGGDFNNVLDLLSKGDLQQDEIRFFVGYAGWAEDQLNQEMKENAWLVTPANKKILFDIELKQIWPATLKQMGGEYEQLIHYPIDPQLN